MKICVLTSYDYGYMPVREITGGVNQKYCESHGYEFLIHCCEKETWSEKVWEKIPELRENLPYYDWIMWIDMDAMFMNQLIRLERLIESAPLGTSLIISKDSSGLNAGVFLLRNTSWSEKLLSVAESTKGHFISHKYPEQEAIDDALKYIDGFPVSYFPAWLLNQFWCTWMPGDFIVHHAGGSVEDKVKGLTPFLDKVIYA